MRTPTKATLGIVSLAILAGSYQAAQANVANTSTVAAGTTDPTIDAGSTVTTTTGEATATTAPTPDAPGATTNNAQAGTGSTSTGSTTGSTGNTSTGSTGTVTTPAPSSGNTSTGSSGSSSSATHTGTAIGYRYGTIQLEVVKSGSQITAINLIQASTKGREWAGVPSTLVSAALAANGTGFSNVGGATFTSEAFRSALESALAQF